MAPTAPKPCFITEHDGALQEAPLQVQRGLLIEGCMQMTGGCWWAKCICWITRGKAKALGKTVWAKHNALQCQPPASPCLHPDDAHLSNAFRWAHAGREPAASHAAQGHAPSIAAAAQARRPDAAGPCTSTPPSSRRRNSCWAHCADSGPPAAAAATSSMSARSLAANGWYRSALQTRASCVRAFAKQSRITIHAGCFPPDCSWPSAIAARPLASLLALRARVARGDSTE